MKLSDILKAAAVAALVYGAYKIGESQGRKTYDNLNDSPDSNEPTEVKSEKDFILQLIDSLKNKPNKTSKEKDTLELLKIKLNQILKTDVNH